MTEEEQIIEDAVNAGLFNETVRLGFTNDYVKSLFKFAQLQARHNHSEAVAIDVNKMVDRFLGWKLPDDFSPDAGISFKRDFNENTPWPMKHEPIGTNLFNAMQAKAMFEYCINYQSDFDLKSTAIRIRRLLNALGIPDPSNGNDNTLMGCLFSLLGQVCRKLESAALQPESEGK